MKKLFVLVPWAVVASTLLALGSLTSAWSEDPPKKNADKWCFAWIATPPKGIGERAALVKGAKWPSGSIITVSFMDGDPAVQKKVMQYAKKWARAAGGPANLTFDFRKDPKTDIRISFKYQGSWSVIGTTCKQVPKDQPTMNYGWLDVDTPELEYQRVVLHEFGHAIGLIHEHQNPAGGIKWNQVQVIKDLSGPPNNWTISEISQNMFETYDANETNFTKTDPKSIMMYPIPKTWTTNGFTAGLNNDLSTTDIKFTAQQYP
jgi:hypothetical protein